MKVYGKVVLNNSFVYAETSDANLVYELHPKPLTHQREREFGLKHSQDILVLHIP